MEISRLYASSSHAPTTFSTGLACLDRATGGGLSSGQLWVITGHPGQGRTTLLTQIAVAAALQHRLATRLVCPRERPDRLRARLNAVVTGRPLTMSRDQESFLAHQQDQVAHLLRAPLHVQAGGGSFAGAEHLNDCDAAVDPARPSCWAVDDVRHDHEGLATLLRGTADRGAIVVVTVPRRGLIDEHGHVLGPWGEASDVVLELDLQEWDDQRDVDARILRNRLGGAQSVQLLDSTWRGLLHDVPEAQCLPVPEAQCLPVPEPSPTQAPIVQDAGVP